MVNSCKVPFAGVAILALLMLVRMDLHAQVDLNCDDFANQAEAQTSLNGTYPEDPNRLDRDSDWIACEDFFELSAEEAARVVPANLVSSATRPTSAPTPASPAVTTVPTPVTTTTAAGSRIDPPADLMAQVASCEVVAVSSRGIAAAGCPGAGTIVLRPPLGTPRMRSQVIIRPGAAFGSQSERVESSAQIVHRNHAERKRGREERVRPRQRLHRTEKSSAQKK